ncbi:hypothetical protein ACU5P1_02280 [Pseudomonas plecoglossicida]|uniref:Phosphatidylinositol diacylglycerol-lyase n=1 Tax=Pseudomonas plecoglossicida TaxID=70775 RepID=A0AAD0R2S1_PSEDL|nr:hypothetical protein [Pseudomonas plecoglossicida]AXM96901.1 hypothetical protein DVB73_14480 [Pseudomonas plecoglossicida]EPB93631.1 hypothetical protein L321_22712 [Pseudomonas plecoglossicida NB2011]QLB53727.1 hypothetical protein HAV28_02270 [Pseudomonas plecoglossicida]
MTGWCPNGRLSPDDICKPANNNRSNWMERYSGARVLPIGETLLLGTHNAAYDQEAPRTPSSETCQDVKIYHQLMWGVRALDLRVQFFSGATGAKRFAIFHSTTNGRHIETDILQELLRYRRNAKADKEIVILNFHRFKNFTSAAHAELGALLKRVLGQSIIPPSCKEAAIVQLWALNKNTVVSYNNAARDASFWPGVNQRWIGRNTPSFDSLGKFVRQVGSEPKVFGDLRAVQAARYSNPFFTPKDISGHIMSWFAATKEGGPIASHYIINTDWSLRCRVADNIIYANAVRARQRGAHVIQSSPNTAGARVQTQSYGIYNLANGNWERSLDFSSNTSGSTSIQVIASDADYGSEIRYGTTVQPIRKGDRLLFKVESGRTPRLLARFNIA